MPLINYWAQYLQKLAKKPQNTRQCQNIFTKKSYSYLIIIYPILILYMLLVFKPKIICKTNNTIIDENEVEISYDKLIALYVCLQIPIFIYLFIRMTEKDD